MLLNSAVGSDLNPNAAINLGDNTGGNRPASDFAVVDGPSVVANADMLGSVVSAFTVVLHATSPAAVEAISLRLAALRHWSSWWIC